MGQQMRVKQVELTVETAVSVSLLHPETFCKQTCTIIIICRRFEPVLLTLHWHLCTLRSFKALVANGCNNETDVDG